LFLAWDKRPTKTSSIVRNVIPAVSFGGILAAISSSVFLPIELLCHSRKNTSPLLLRAVSTDSWTTPMMKVFFEIQKKKLPIFLHKKQNICVCQNNFVILHAKLRVA